MLLKNIESYIAANPVNNVNDKDIMSDIRYVCKSCSLITESLQKGCDVMQMPNGDIIVTELKAVTFQYTWDDKKGKLVRVQATNKARRVKPRKSRKSAYNEETAESELEELEELV